MLPAVKNSLTTLAPITPAVISSEQSVANTFTKAGLIPSQINFSQFAVTTYNNLLSIDQQRGTS